MDSYIRAGLVNIIRRYVPNEISKHIESKINKIIYPIEITHIIFRYIPKEMIKYLKNKTYYLKPVKKHVISSSIIPIISDIKTFDWKRLYYEIFKERDVKIEYLHPKKNDNLYLTGLINRRRGIIFNECRLKIKNFGQLFVKGRNYYRELGLEDNNEIKKWTRIPLKESVIWVVCGSHHSILLTKCGKVYVTGESLDGQLGLGDKIEHYKWKNVKLDEKIIQISATDYASFILSNSGKLFGTGRNVNGELGLGDIEYIYKWQQVFQTQSLGQQVFQTQSLGQQVNLNINFDEKIAQIECGATHSLLLTTNGNVYGTGQNDNCQLGLYNSAESMLQLKDLSKQEIKNRLRSDIKNWRIAINKWSLILFPEKVVKISCYYNYSMALTVNGKIFATGVSLSCLFMATHWKEIKFPYKIVNIMCSYEYTTIITNNGKIIKINAEGEQII